MNYNNPDFKASRLQDCEFWFEECEIPGGLVDGCADIRIDECGEWYFHSMSIGSWTKPRWSEHQFTGQHITFTETNADGTLNEMFEVMRAWLVKHCCDDITETCMAED